MNGSIERRVGELKQGQSGSPEQKTRGGTGGSFLHWTLATESNPTSL
jgi:hypothetical protein